MEASPAAAPSPAATPAAPRAPRAATHAAPAAVPAPPPSPRPAPDRGRRGGGEPRRGQAAAGGPCTLSSRLPGSRPSPRPRRRARPQEEPAEGVLPWAARGFLQGRRLILGAEEARGTEEARGPARRCRRTSSRRARGVRGNGNPILIHGPPSRRGDGPRGSYSRTFDKWKLRDQETAPKKSGMLRMDDSEDEEEERNLGNHEGTKKGKLRVKMEGEASSLREKMEQMMKAREELTTKTLETKLLITENKKEVWLAQVEAKHEEAKRKADLEERMIKLKEAKVWKELMVEEKEHMMMSKKDMDQEQLQWWKDYKEDIAERKRIFRGASSTLRGDTPMSGGGDGGVEDSTTGDNGGA
ncbi:putative methionyl-tRNA synthetase [Hordeum vulgare]|nr:putative methionyl-tRNA synthetase [Hordeum vulgare]